MKTRESKVIFQTYKRYPIEVSHAKGCRIFDVNGDSYLDMLGGIAVNAMGHGHPAIIAAAKDQIDKYMHISNYFYQAPQVELAEKLVKMSCFDRIFFSNSGTEAMEGAIKLVRKWGKKNGKSTLVAFSGGFHGRTYGALSIMDKPNYKEDMGPFLDDTCVIPHNDVEALEATINEKTAAVFLEFVQGEGGLSTPSAAFISKINELKEKFGFLLVADEIQAGIGRTGKLFGFEHFDVDPDVATMAKGIGGGLPLGGIAAKEFLADIWNKGQHGTTYGGNAVACATGLAVLKELEHGVMEHVQKVGNFLEKKLLNIRDKYSDKVLEVRGIGLMKGLALNFDAAILVEKLVQKKVVANAASGTVLRLVPPLIISYEEITHFIEVLDNALNEL